jgi:hypothetical protein
MGRLGRGNVVLSVLTSIMLLASGLGAQAGSQWIETGDSDFMGGQRETVNITGTGQDASLELALNISSGLMGEWLFDEASGPVAIDTSGNHRNGTIINGIRFPGKHDGGLNFTSPGGVVDLPNDLWAVNMSLEAWVDIHDFGSTDPNYCGKGIFFKAADTGAARDYTLMAVYCGGIKGLNFWFGNDGSHYVSLTTTGLEAWNWYHIVATRNGTQAIIYINGVQAASKPYSFVPVNQHHGLGLATSVVTGQFFEGILDDVRIYDRALSADEVMAHFGQSVAGKYTSRPKDTGGRGHFGKLHINSTAPSSTAVRLQVRTADTLANLSLKSFVGPDGLDIANYMDPVQQLWTGHDGDRWVQYRVTMTSTVYPVAPKVQDVMIDYNLEQNVTVTSPNGGENWTGTHNITWSAGDPDGDTLSFDIYLSNDNGSTYPIHLASGLPNAQRRFQWDTGMLPNGTKYRVKVVTVDHNTEVQLNATDQSDRNFTIYHPFNASHPPKNHAPVVQRPPDAVVYENSTYNVTVVATDADGDNLQYDLIDHPPAATRPQPNTVVWATGTSVGDWNFTMKVSDGKVNVTVSWKVTVLKRPIVPPTNHRPTVTLLAPLNGTTLGVNLVDLSWKGSDSDGDPLSYQVYLDTVDGRTLVSKQNGTKYNAIGLKMGTTYYWAVRADDGRANGTNLSGTWNFKTMTIPPPTCSITEPTNGHTVSGTIVVKGTAKLGNQQVVMLRLRMEVSLDGGQWQNISGTTAWQFTILTNDLSDGVHHIRARAYDGFTYSAVAEITVYVNNHPEKYSTKTENNVCMVLLGTAALLLVATVVARLFRNRKTR